MLPGIVVGPAESSCLTKPSALETATDPNFFRMKEVAMTQCCSIPLRVLFGSTALAFIITSTALAGYPAKNVVLRSHLPLSDFGASFAEDSWGYVSDSGREYAIIGLSNGTGFVEITDPDNPVIVAVMAQPNHGRDMKVYQNYVYSTSDSGPTHVYDVSDIDSGVITLVLSFNQGAHNLAVDEVSGFLYLAGGGSMDVYDLSDPADPTFVGSWPGQTHDAQVVTYTDGPYAGRQIAFVFAGWDGRLDIVDVTDKADIFLVGQTSYPDPGYTHNGWLTADRQYIYVSDEVDFIPRTTIIDVSDLGNPTFIGDFTICLDSRDHNLYVRDGFIFEANYSSGMHIFDASDPVNPFEVGYFDTYPPDNDESGDGAWNVFPFFPSGTVIVSDRSSGLFVLDVSQATGGCEADADGDGVCDEDDICPGGDDTIDTDNDCVPDFCDPCPLENQDDTDGDGVCDSDDPCPLDNPDDTDGDGVCESDDNCPDHANPDQTDCQPNGVGDVCDIVNGTSNDNNKNDIPDECEGPMCGDCPTDVDGNGETEAFDLANLLGAWGPVTPSSACLDADGNGFIEAFDLAVLLGDWGPCG